jgi:hypothetical protein
MRGVLHLAWALPAAFRSLITGNDGENKTLSKEEVSRMIFLLLGLLILAATGHFILR